MLSNCIFTLHFSYHQWGWVYCQIFKHRLYSLIRAHCPIVLFGFLLIYMKSPYIEDINLLWWIFNLQNLKKFLFYGCNNLLEFSDTNCTYFKFFFCLFYYSKNVDWSWKSLYICLLCLSKDSLSDCRGKAGPTGILFSRYGDPPGFLGKRRVIPWPSGSRAQLLPTVCTGGREKREGQLQAARAADYTPLRGDWGPSLLFNNWPWAWFSSELFLPGISTLFFFHLFLLVGD